MTKKSNLKLIFDYHKEFEIPYDFHNDETSFFTLELLNEGTIFAPWSEKYNDYVGKITFVPNDRNNSIKVTFNNLTHPLLERNEGVSAILDTQKSTFKNLKHFENETAKPKNVARASKLHAEIDEFMHHIVRVTYFNNDLTILT
jgi:hypothetical protein